MAEKLKSCPFCSGEARRTEITQGEKAGARFIECRSCHVCTELMWPEKDDVDELLTESWNRRAPDPAIEKAREALHLAVARMERLLAEQTHCGDPNWECPLHDAHKDYDIAGELPQLHEALVLLGEVE